IKCTFDTDTVTSNGLAGVYLHGNNGAASASIGAIVKNSKITSNTGIGVRIDEAPATVTTETLQNNDISSNAGGGVAFSTASTLNGFTGNTIHSNTGDQIVVAARQTANATWDFHSPTGCDANRNQVYCYQSGVGIRVTSVPFTMVDASFMTWANAVPTAAVDYVKTLAGDTVTVTSPCAAQPSCP
ncbi:MAG TPA: right-handed parallel beta-helix repeat-containing protein, partial [Polyangia bacterium]|nr:right-handed parallel beta-helix repeat-containing protein [Polyangia bacterium]